MVDEGMGADWLQRVLRTISVLSFLALTAVVVADANRTPDLGLEALLVGAILIQLGYDIAVPVLTDVIAGIVGRRKEE